MNKTVNQKAWFFVIPVFVLVAFNAVIPLMTVVNYAFQETFGSNVFNWEGTRWFKQILQSDRFHAALGRQFTFTSFTKYSQTEDTSSDNKDQPQENKEDIIVEFLDGVAENEHKHKKRSRCETFYHENPSHKNKCKCGVCSLMRRIQSLPYVY